MICKGAFRAARSCVRFYILIWQHTTVYIFRFLLILRWVRKNIISGLPYVHLPPGIVSIQYIFSVAPTAHAVGTIFTWTRWPHPTSKRSKSGGDTHPEGSSLPTIVGLPRVHPTMGAWASPSASRTRTSLRLFLRIAASVTWSELVKEKQVGMLLSSTATSTSTIGGLKQKHTLYHELNAKSRRCLVRQSKHFLVQTTSPYPDR